MENYQQLYLDELLNEVVPFWGKHSLDKENGGYFTCLLADGTVYDTDKFIWLQARQVWTFAKLYNELEARSEWLNIALHGAKFLEKYGRDAKGDWYFSLNQKGQPLIQPYNIFSDCFATMAFGQLYKATNEKRYATIATQTFHNILQRKDNPKGVYNKSIASTRPLRNFTLPMILCNLTLEMESILDSALVEQTIDTCIKEVMDVFYQPALGLVVENVAPSGTLVDSFEGRLLNPGHAIEAMWFIMDLAKRKKDTALIEKAVAITLNTIEYGWDQQYGGIYYFLDRKGYPPQQLEWNQKLWWVHLETLIALSKGYVYTQNKACWSWFEKIQEYTWNHFRDTVDGGEWYGYLNRQGEVLLPLKGGKWKGCFHVPRALFILQDTLKKQI